MSVHSESIWWPGLTFWPIRLGRGTLPWRSESRKTCKLGDDQIGEQSDYRPNLVSLSELTSNPPAPDEASTSVFSHWQYETDASR